MQSEAGGRKENQKITRAVQGCAGLCLACFCKLKAALSVRLLHRFQSQTRSFSLFFRSGFVLKFNMFLTSFFDRFGCPKGANKGAKIDRNRAKLGSRRLLKRYFLKNVYFSLARRFPMFFHQNRPQDEAKIGPRSPQDGRKTVLRSDRF